MHVDGLQSPTECKKREKVDVMIESRWDTSISPPDIITRAKGETWEAYHDIVELPRQILNIEDADEAN